MTNLKGVILAILCVVFIFSVTTVQDAAAADKCYTFYYNWNCLIDNNYDYKTWDYEYYMLKDDGTFTTTEGFEGFWYLWKGSLALRHTNGCQKIAAGKKNTGYMHCTNGSSPGLNYVPGCWYMKKTKCTVFESE